MHTDPQVRRDPEPESAESRPRLDAHRISLALALLALGAAWALGTRRFAMDGSFWESEAFIAWSLLQLPPSELFGPLLTPHSFPRLYLFSISLLQHVIGYETAVLRALPWIAFLAAMALFVRMLHDRHRSRPVLLATGLVLLLATPVPYAYAAMLKQYTLDLALALVALRVGDRFLDVRLRDGRRLGSLVLLALPILLSFTYVIVLAARLGGWWLARGLRGAWSLDLRATLAIGSATLLALASLWWTDLRHTAEVDGLFRFWSKCNFSGDVLSDLMLVLRLSTAWWTDYSPWGTIRGVLGIPGRIVLTAFIVIGIAGSVRQARGASTIAPPDAEHFGSRGLACALVLVGLMAVSALTGYPICANNLTLFALPAVLMLVLEGVAWTGVAMEGLRHGRTVWRVVSFALLLACIPTAVFNIAHQWSTPPPADVRPLLERATNPALPLVVAACSTAQIKTLPELAERDDLIYFHEGVMPDRNGSLPALDRYLVLSAGTQFLCPWFLKRLDTEGMRYRPVLPGGRGSALWLVEKKTLRPGEWQRERRREKERGGG